VIESAARPFPAVENVAIAATVERRRAARGSLSAAAMPSSLPCPKTPSCASRIRSLVELAPREAPPGPRSFDRGTRSCDRAGQNSADGGVLRPQVQRAEPRDQLPRVGPGDLDGPERARFDRNCARLATAGLVGDGSLARATSRNGPVVEVARSESVVVMIARLLHTAWARRRHSKRGPGVRTQTEVDARIVAFLVSGS